MAYIYRKKRLVVLRLRDPSRVLTVIPGAKLFEHGGKQYVAVKHAPEEVKVLHNIGIHVPSPIGEYYNYPGRFKPFHAQRETTKFLTLNNRAFVLNGMGTGKTLATLWSYDYLRSLGLLKRTLVITPLSTLERTWGDELFNHFPNLTYSVLYGSQQHRLKALQQDVDIYLINHDGIKVDGMVDALAKRDDIDLIIVDEVAQIARNAGTDRFKALNTIINKQVPRKAWGLTGTPTPNKPTDAWAQCKLLVPERVPAYFNRFRDMVERQVSQFAWLPRPEATTVVFEAMQPAVRFTMDECTDLPPCVFETRTAPLTPIQTRAFKDMMATLCTEAGEGTLVAANEAVKAQKLVQIACGRAYDQQGGTVTFDAGPRLNLVSEIIEEAGTKVIVFVPFVSVIEHIKEHLEAEGHSVACIHGSVGKSERDAIFSAFQRSADPRVLVAQPAAMSHGLTLTAASTIIWYAPITSNDIFEQANARIVRPGQKHAQLVVMIEGTEIEEKYYRRLKNKQRVQGVLLDMVKDSRAIA